MTVNYRKDGAHYPQVLAPDNRFNLRSVRKENSAVRDVCYTDIDLN